MIDYEKLEKALSLCKMRSKENGGEVSNLIFGFTNGELCFWLYDSIHRVERDYDSLDELIAKLEEIMKPEPLYNDGDFVFFRLSDNSIGSERVGHSSWDENSNEYYYMCGCFKISESDLFPTRQALIEYQINYWQNQLEKEPKPDCYKCHNYRAANKMLEYDCCCIEPDPNSDRCQHESDGEVYPIIGFNGKVDCLKCIKCGGFYR